jgi:hypothetical protein
MIEASSNVAECRYSPLIGQLESAIFSVLAEEEKTPMHYRHDRQPAVNVIFNRILRIWRMRVNF